MTSEIMDKKLIKALGVETRRDIIKMLAKRPYTASEISKITNKHVTTISQHLGTLEKSGLIHKRDDKHKWKYYELSGKGEKLFKTKYYSWIVVFGISALALVGGFSRLFAPTSSMAATTEQAIRESAPAGAPLADAATKVVEVAPMLDATALTLIALATIGLIFSAWKIKRARDIFY